MNLQLLKKALAQFGLNPHEWRLELTELQGQIAQIHIRRKDDPSIYFVGHSSQNIWLSVAVL